MADIFERQIKGAVESQLAPKLQTLSNAVWVGGATTITAVVAFCAYLFTVVNGINFQLGAIDQRTITMRETLSAVSASMNESIKQNTVNFASIVKRLDGLDARIQKVDDRLVAKEGEPVTVFSRLGLDYSTRYVVYNVRGTECAFPRNEEAQQMLINASYPVIEITPTISCYDVETFIRKGNKKSK